MTGDRATRRRAGRLVARGEAGQNLEEARVAVTMARKAQRLERLTGRWSLRLFPLLVLLWSWQAVDAFRDARPLVGMLLVGWIVFGVWVLVTLWRGRGMAERAERLNLAVLAAAGVAPPEPSADSPLERALSHGAVPPRALAAIFVVGGLAFGLLTTVENGEELTPARVLGYGLPFAAATTAVVWFFARRQRKARA